MGDKQLSRTWNAPPSKSDFSDQTCGVKKWQNRAAQARENRGKSEMPCSYFTYTLVNPLVKLSMVDYDGMR